MVLNEVLTDTMSLEQAAQILGLSVRQVRRLKTAYGAQGPAALVHGNRGRPPAHALPAPVRAQIQALGRERYAGFHHQHLTEKLAEEPARPPLARTTVRQIMLEVGLRSPRTRRAPAHRSRRERMPRAGLLLQADGSPHRWLGPEKPRLTLIGGIDDATGQVPWALFREQEDAQGYMEWLWAVSRHRGLPVALSVDRHGIFQRRAHERWTHEEELAGGPLPTPFGRVLAELGIQPIDALSPQAKGRVERLWRTLQDRLVAELRLAGVQTLDEANQFLPIFVGQFNARFAVPPSDAAPAWRAWPADLVPERVFCFKDERVVKPDNTVHFGHAQIQLLPSPQRANWARARVDVHEQLDGGIAIFAQGALVATRDAPPDAPTLRARQGPRPGAHASPRPAPARPGSRTHGVGSLHRPPAAAGAGAPGPEPPLAPLHGHPQGQNHVTLRRTKSPDTYRPRIALHVPTVVQRPSGSSDRNSAGAAGAPAEGC